MKTHIFLVVICIMPALVKSQDYHPFNMVNSSWNELKSEDHDGIGFTDEIELPFSRKRVLQPAEKLAGMQDLLIGGRRIMQQNLDPLF